MNPAPLIVDLPKVGLLIAAACLSDAALACEISSPPADWRDAPISVRADCSWVEAGSAFERDIKGGPAIDLGGGRIGQRVTREEGCGWGEHLLVVDCKTGEMIGLEGQRWESGTLGGTKVDLLYPPKGKVRLTPKTTVPDLVALSEREGYTYWLDVTARIKAMKKRNRPDPTCGCRLFYPDSGTN